MSTSFPFLALARRRHLDYGDVLLAADFRSLLERMGTIGIYKASPHMHRAIHRLSQDDIDAIGAVAEAERSRRDKVEEVA